MNSTEYKELAKLIAEYAIRKLEAANQALLEASRQAGLLGSALVAVISFGSAKESSCGAKWAIVLAITSVACGVLVHFFHGFSLYRSANEASRQMTLLRDNPNNWNLGPIGIKPVRVAWLFAAFQGSLLLASLVTVVANFLF